MYFEIVGEISAVETIAVGSSIREVERLRKLRDPHGRGRWRKRKGTLTLSSKMAGCAALRYIGTKHTV